MANTTNRSLVTSRAAADMLGIERRTLIRMEEAGVIKPIRPHPTGHRMYRLSELEAILGGDEA